MATSKAGKGKAPPKKPAAILLSKRAAVVYLEHARVLQKDGRVLYLTGRDGDVEQMFLNIPFRNTSVLFLGKGTSITDSAMRLLAEAGVLVGFTGSGGSPVISAADPMFLAPQGEYRPTEYMQAWIRMWVDDEQRLALGKRLLMMRLTLAEQHYAASKELAQRKIVITDQQLTRFEAGIKRATSTMELLLTEAEWVKGLYKAVAAGYRMPEFTREERVTDRGTVVKTVNAMLTHGNYIAYGYAAASLYTMGVSFALPVLHGKTRRGGLVFDIADLVKDWTVLPLAFQHGFAGDRDQEYREALIAHMQSKEVLDIMFDSIKTLASEKVN